MSNDKPARRQARTARFYQAGAITPGEQLTLDKQSSHHLNTVLRARVNDNVILFNGDGADYLATIVEAAQRGAAKYTVLQIEQRLPGVPDSPMHITLVQCVSRAERMDISLRQSVELGVNRIQPVYSRYSVKAGDEKRTDKKQQHWQSIVTSACEQSGRSTLPELMPAMSYERWLTSINQQYNLYILAPSARHTLSTLIATAADSKLPRAASLIIGPESGLDEDEIDLAEKAGAIPVQLGQRILRTETAGPAAIAILQALSGDLQA